MNLIQNNWKLYLFEGIIFVILGALALASPALMTLSIELLIGALFVVGGLAQAWRTFKMWGAPGFFVSLFGAAVAVIAGLWLLAYPLVGVLAMTMLLAIFFLIQGIVNIIYGLEFRSFPGWGGLVFSGILSLVLAWLIWSGWPTSAIWVIGVYVGIYLLVLGFTMVFIALAGRKHIKHRNDR